MILPHSPKEADVPKMKWNAYLTLPMTVCLMLLTLAGCGRRGPLETEPSKGTNQPLSMNPSESSQPQKPTQTTNIDGTKNPGSTTRGVKKPFPLDPLL
jgi:predicted small lipoprotein YifL